MISKGKEQIKELVLETGSFSVEPLKILPQSISNEQIAFKPETIENPLLTPAQETKIMKIADPEPPKYFQKLIVLDVKRTSLNNVSEKELIMLLENNAKKFPKLNYYQGLNLIGVFLLDFCEDYQIAEEILERLSQELLSKYFEDSFSKLKYLFYITDSLVESKIPTVASHLKAQTISSK